jgi:hypothetical protein
MTQQIEFMRLTTGEEIVASVTHNGDKIRIDNPLIVEVENFMEEGTQMLYMKEYLPQSIVDIKSVEIPSNMVIIAVKVSDAFLNQYNEATEYFYSMEIETKKPSKRKATKMDETGKVVALFEAILEKKDKPVH